MKAPESGWRYVFEYTHKVTGMTETTEVWEDDYETAEKVAIHRVFAIAEDCAVSLIETDEPDKEPDYSLLEKLDARYV
jgi:hypothetical protein